MFRYIALTLRSFYQVTPLVVLRAAQGALQGPIQPVMFHMAGSWMPNNEKTWLLSLMVSGKEERMKFR